MKQRKTGLLKKTTTSFVTVVFAVAAVGMISVNAVNPVTGTIPSNGYLIYAKTSHTTYKASGIGKVTSGGPTSITVKSTGFHLISGSYIDVVRKTKKNENTQSVSVTTETSPYVLNGSKCLAKFQGEISLTAKDF